MDAIEAYDTITAIAATIRGLSDLLRGAAASEGDIRPEALELLATVAGTAADDLDGVAASAMDGAALPTPGGEVRRYEIECHGPGTDEVDTITYLGHLEGAVAQARHDLHSTSPLAYAVIYDSAGTVILRISAATTTAELGPI